MAISPKSRDSDRTVFHPPRSILIIRLGAIGDVVFASALIPVLRRSFPETRLTWLIDEAYADLLIHNPRLDRVATWPRARWRKLRRQRRYGTLWREFRELVGNLRAERFDWVLDLQGLMKSGLWAWLSGGRSRIGLGSREGSQYLMTRCIDRRTPFSTIGSEYRKLAQELGLDPGAFGMDLALSHSSIEAARRIKANQGIAGPYAVFCPLTTRPQKHWLDEYWGTLSQTIAARYGWPVILLGGAGEVERSRSIAARAGPELKNLAGQTPLGVAGALIRGANLVVGVDTGLTHMGIALGRPTVALFGSTAPYLDTGCGHAVVLYQALPCSPCQRRPTCDGDFTCMKRLSPAIVFAAVERLLADSSTGLTPASSPSSVRES
ncbi:MAG TPA: glycosyltransferase family 9 protein [Methylococcus sp.]|nr:glycosyltransferase family 9 protein [Methylococcus sp.]